MVNIYFEFIFTKLGSGAFLIYMVISVYFYMNGDAQSAELWLRLSEAYITYNAASYLLTNEKSSTLPVSQNSILNFFHWFLNNFFSKKVIVLCLAMALLKYSQIHINNLFEIGIFMLGGRIVEKFSRGVQKEMTGQKKVQMNRVTVKADEEEGEA